MPITTYDSPTSFAPKIGFEPNGFLGGMWAGQRNNDYRDAVEQSNLMKALSMREAQNKLEEYNLNSQVREMERRSKISGFETAIETKPSIERSKATIESEKARVAPSNTDKTISDNQSAISDNQLKTWGRPAQLMSTYGPSLIDSEVPVLSRLATYDKLKQQFPEMQLPDNYDPIALKGHIQSANKIQKMIEERTLAKTKMEQDAHMERTKAEIEGKKAVERIKEAAKAAADQKVGNTIIEINKLEAIPEEKLTLEQRRHLDRLYINLKTEQAARLFQYGIPSQILNQGETTPRALGGAAGQMVEGIRGVITPQQSNPQEAAWNEAWAKLEPGQSMKGLNGLTYTKKRTQ